MSQCLGMMGRGGEGGSRLSSRWGGPGGGTAWSYTSVARMVHNTYWVPEGRAVDAIAGTLRSGRWTRLQVVPLLFSKTYRRLPLHPPHRGGREGV